MKFWGRIASCSRFSTGFFGPPQLPWRPVENPQQRMLRTDRRIVEPRGDRMRQRHLAVVVLQKIAVGAVQHARTSAGEACGVLAQASAAAAGLHSDQTNGSLRDKGMENPDRVA